MFVSSEDWKPKGVASLEPAAIRALQTTAESINVVASAGAGKTEFLAQKADFLLETGICRTPQRILAISFKSDAAKNLADRVRQRCRPQHAARFDSMTFDAFTKSVIDRFGGLVPPPYTPSVDYSIVFPGRRDWLDFLTHQGRRDLSESKMEQAVARVQLPIQQRDIPAHWKALLETYWANAFRNLNDTKLSFAMINRLAEYVLRSNPKLITAIQATYPFVFLDEFQDTTFSQYDLLKRALLNSNTKLTAVGDNKQRIMVWAGAMQDGFEKLENDFSTRTETFLSNWRSHPELVEIQHAIALSLEGDSAKPNAMGVKIVQGSVSAIWSYDDRDSECESVAVWIADEVERGVLSPEDCAILVRFRADRLEDELAPTLAQHGLVLRNVARNVGKIAIQDVLTEELTQCVMAFIRLGARQKSPDDWHFIVDRLTSIWGLDPESSSDGDLVQVQTGEFLPKLRRYLTKVEPSENACRTILSKTLEFMGEQELRASVPHYTRDVDFERVREGLELLLIESIEDETEWDDAIDRFDGIGQVPLMSIHKSKGLEFHTVVFFGLDTGSWWNFEPEDSEEMRAFFVAFTRAKQRAFFTSCRGRGGEISYIDELVSSVGVPRIGGPKC